MKLKYLLASTIFFAFGAANAGELGVGKDGPNAAPTTPTETESSSDQFWQELLEWFEIDSGE